MALKVTGRVQGVGFRWWAKHEAGRLGLRGWIWNHADGSVRLIMDGGPGPLAEFERALWKGPPMARVGGVVTEASRVPVHVDGVRIGSPSPPGAGEG